MKSCHSSQTPGAPLGFNSLSALTSHHQNLGSILTETMLQLSHSDVILLVLFQIFEKPLDD